jgi:hypothetical protein
MKIKTVRGRLSQSGIDHLSRALTPIRTRREVAGILGISITLVCRLENSALGKILQAMTEDDINETNKQNEQNEQNKRNGESNHE